MCHQEYRRSPKHQEPHVPSACANVIAIETGGAERSTRSNPPAAHRAFRCTHEQRQTVARALRYIDDARRALESQQIPTTAKSFASSRPRPTVFST